MLETDLGRIQKFAATLIDFQDDDEQAYNLRVAESNPAHFALMDRKDIQHGGGRSKIEFCDLYTLDKKLIHVKRYGGSSVLSHLFSQGMISARLFLSDVDFRRKLNTILPETHKLSDPAVKPAASEYEVVYAIISNSNEGDLSLPLFSKINLRNAFNTLSTFGFRVSIAVVKMAQGQPPEALPNDA